MCLTQQTNNCINYKIAGRIPGNKYLVSLLTMSNTPSVLRLTHGTDVSVDATTPVQIAACAAVIEMWSQYFRKTHTKPPLTTVFWLQPVYRRWPVRSTAEKVVSHTRTCGLERGLGARVPLDVKPSAVCQVCNNQWRLKLEDGQIFYHNSPRPQPNCLHTGRFLHEEAQLHKHTTWALPIAENLLRPSIPQNCCYYTPDPCTFIQ